MEQRLEGGSSAGECLSLKCAVQFTYNDMHRNEAYAADLGNHETDKA